MREREKGEILHEFKKDRMSIFFKFMFEFDKSSVRALTIPVIILSLLTRGQIQKRQNMCMICYLKSTNTYTYAQVLATPPILGWFFFRHILSFLLFTAFLYFIIGKIHKIYISIHILLTCNNLQVIELFFQDADAVLDIEPTTLSHTSSRPPLN